MADAPNGERRRATWGPIIATVITLAIPALVGWGVIQSQVAAHGSDLKKHDDRLDKIESTYIRDRDLIAVHDRLRRIETQLDQLLTRSMRNPTP